MHGHDIKADIKLHQISRYRSLMSIFRVIACRASETEETYNLSISKADDLCKENIENMLSIWLAMQREVTNDEQRPSNNAPKTSKWIGQTMQKDSRKSHALVKEK